MKDFLEFYKTHPIEELKRKYVQTIILATSWSIWKVRNEGILNGKRATIDGIFGEMQGNTFLWIKCRAKKTVLDWRSVNFEFYNGV
ncbi:hypothetical protein HanIR_Chr07g0313901 [Helianthus annuus]|nr:hypothetical protein HanIR_Chr07g0313901 [Helianthus annuus]